MKTWQNKIVTEQSRAEQSRAEQSRADSDLDLGLGQQTLVDTDYNDYRDSDLDLGQQTLVDTSRQIVTWTAFAILAMF